MVEPEFLPSEVLNRCKHAVRRCTRRHREHEFVRKLRVRSSPARSNFGGAAMLFYVHLPAPTEVCNVTAHCPEVLPTPTEHFNHDFRRSTHGACNQLYLFLRQGVPATRTTTRVAGDFQKRLSVPDFNESSRHALAPMRSDSPELAL